MHPLRAQNAVMGIDGQSDDTITRHPEPARAASPWSAPRTSHGGPRTAYSASCSPAATTRRRSTRCSAGRTIHGRTVVARLADAAPLDMVDIFRASANAGAAVDEAIRLGARTVWMQLGVVDKAAAERARAAGITVVMDRCPVIEVRRLGLARH